MSVVFMANSALFKRWMSSRMDDIRWDKIARFKVFLLFFLIIFDLPIRGDGTVAAGVGQVELGDLLRAVHDDQVIWRFFAVLPHHMGQHSFFALLHIDDLIDCALRNEGKFGRNLPDYMVLYAVDKVH
jgi:hypothetical protein